MKKIMLFIALGLSLFAFDIKQIEPNCKIQINKQNVLIKYLMPGIKN